MTIITNIDHSEHKKILALEEGAYIDFKSCQIAPAKLSRTISAFANTGGGEIFIGVSENQNNLTWYGYKNQEAANPIFQVLNLIDPSAQSYKTEFLKCEGQTGLLLHLIIFKSRQIIKATDDHPYIRRNAQSLPVKDPEGLKQLKLDKGVESYEDQTLNTAKENITNSNTILSFILNVVPSAEPEEWLTKQDLIYNSKPTVAAALLFADEPQIALPKRSAVKLFRYKTKDSEGNRDALVFDPITIEGCIYQLIKETVAQTKTIIEEISVLTGEGLEKIYYPDEALHEIITNAVLHRDYSITKDIHVKIFDNRVEVASPGRLPAHITVKNILHEQSSRNPKLVRLINKFPNPPNKDVGEGLNTAFEAMRKHRLKEPTILENEHDVIVIIRHESLASPHDIVMEYLNKYPEIKNGEARELTAITSENSMKKVFIDLKEKGLIEPVPGKKGSASAWQKKTSAPPEKIAKDLFEFAKIK